MLVWLPTGFLIGIISHRIYLKITLKIDEIRINRIINKELPQYCALVEYSQELQLRS